MSTATVLANSTTVAPLVTTIEFECNYGYRLDHGYPCQITKGQLLNRDYGESVTFVGKHQAGKNDNDLKLISFSGNRNLRLHVIPSKVFVHFPHLVDFSLQRCELRTLKNGDFSSAGNLKNLNLDSNELTRLDAAPFGGADVLEWLSLSANKLDTMHKDAFVGLGKLQMLILSQNKLQTLNAETFHPLTALVEVLLDGNGMEILSAGLFERNMQMKRIWLQNNRISQIDPKFFQPLVKLVFINLEMNVCVNEVFRKQYRETEIQLNEALKTCNPTKEAMKI